VVALNPAEGPIPKPVKVEKAPYRGLPRGGKKSKDAGRSYEQRFTRKYDEPDGALDHNCKPLVHYHRVPGSGAFVTLPADVLAEIGSLNIAFELKSWLQLDGRGAKTVAFSASLLDKIDEEARQLNRVPMFVYHIKGDSEEWAVIRYSWLAEKLRDYEVQIRALTLQLEEAMAA